MLSRPQISIINLCYNTGERVIKTFKSIKLQKFRSFELISIDDASYDNSYAILKNWLETNANFSYKLLKNEKNEGIVETINKALSYASGKYIAVVADDIWQPEFLERLHNEISTNRNVGVVYTKANVYNLNEQIYKGELDPISNAEIIKYPRRLSLFRKDSKNRYFIKGELLQDHIFWINPIISFSFLGKRELFVDGYNKKYWMEDMPKWYQLSKKTDFLFIDEVLATYIIHDKNVSVTRKLPITLGVLEFLLDHFKEIKFPDTKKYVERKIIAMFTNKEISVDDLSNKKLVFLLVYLLRSQPKIFSKVLFINAKEVIHKWKVQLFR